MWFVIIALSRFIAELQINILFKRILCDTLSAQRSSNHQECVCVCPSSKGYTQSTFCAAPRILYLITAITAPFLGASWKKSHGARIHFLRRRRRLLLFFSERRPPPRSPCIIIEIQAQGYCWWLLTERENEYIGEALVLSCLPCGILMLPQLFGKRNFCSFGIWSWIVLTVKNENIIATLEC